MKRARHTSATAAEQEASSRSAMENQRSTFSPQQAGLFPHGAWSTQQSVAFPANFPLPGWGYEPSSPEYVDGDALGGFNPNTASARTPFAFIASHNSQHDYSSTYSGSSATGLRRGPLLFAPGLVPQFSKADAEMIEIINNCSTAAASCPGFGTQEETLDNDVDMDEEVEDEEMEEEPAEP